MEAVQKANSIEIARLEQLLVEAYAAASRKETENNAEIVKLMEKQSALQASLNGALKA